MSHELRTPLNAILGYTELILDGIYGEAPQKAQDVLKRVESNGRHLLGLINDVLDLSKIEAGQLTLTLTDYSMKDVLYNVFSAVEPLGQRQEARLQGRSAARHAEGPRRRAAAHAGGAQPRRQRHQVQRHRRGDHQGEFDQRLVHGRRAGQRPRHLHGRSGQDLRGIPAGRQFRHQEEGRHRPRPVDLAAHRRAARRQALGRIRSSARARCSPSRCRSRWRRRPSNEGAGAQDNRKKAQGAAPPDNGKPAPPQRREPPARISPRSRRDLAEAQEQQAATADVLRIIATSHGDLEPVFKAMLANAVRICGAKFGTLYRYDGKTFHVAALHNAPREFAEARRQAPLQLSTRPQGPRSIVQSRRRRLCTSPIFERNRPTVPIRCGRSSCTMTGGAQSPLRADPQGRRTDRRHRHLPPGGAPVHRQADRAGDELRRPGRDRHREHAAAQRAAPAHRRSHRSAGAADRDLEVLKVISTSPGDLEPVFRVHAGERDAHLRGQRSATCSCCEGRRLPLRRRLHASGLAEYSAEAAVDPSRLGRHCRRVAKPNRSLHIADMTGRSEPTGTQPRRDRVEVGGARTLLACRCSRTASWSAHRHLSPGGAAVHRQADRAGAELRRPGRHRHREHAAAQRAAPAHRRSHRIAGAADRDLRGAQGHQQLARRSGTGVRGHAGERDAHLRGEFGIVFRSDGERPASRLASIGVHRADAAELHGDRGPFVPAAGTRLGRAACDKARSFTSRDTRPKQSSSRRAESAATHGGARSTACRADAQGRRAGRRHSSSTARRCGRSPTSRSSWSRTSPTRP